jgi:hypothetical protein
MSKFILKSEILGRAYQVLTCGRNGLYINDPDCLLVLCSLISSSNMQKGPGKPLGKKLVQVPLGIKGSLSLPFTFVEQRIASISLFELK